MHFGHQNSSINTLRIHMLWNLISLVYQWYSEYVNMRVIPYWKYCNLKFFFNKNRRLKAFIDICLMFTLNDCKTSTIFICSKSSLNFIPFISGIGNLKPEKTTTFGNIFFSSYLKTRRCFGDESASREHRNLEKDIRYCWLQQLMDIIANKSFEPARIYRQKKT